MPERVDQIGRKLAIVIFCVACGGCGFSSLAVIPTLLAAQSRLEGCPGNFQLPGNSLELTFVIVEDDGSTTPVDAGPIMWSVTEGTADIDETLNNPVDVSLTQVGVVTIRGDYNPEDQNVNPAICRIFVQAE